MVNLRYVIILLLLATGLAGKGLRPVKSEVSFRAEHKFKEIRGVCEKVSLKGLNLAGGRVLTAAPFEVVIPVTAVTTGNSSRDANMLDVIGYPAFREIRGKVESFSQIAENRYRIRGSLTINGRTRPFASEAVASTENLQVALAGMFTILLDDYKIERPSLLFVSIKNNVEISYRFVFEK